MRSPWLLTLLTLSILALGGCNGSDDGDGGSSSEGGAAGSGGGSDSGDGKTPAGDGDGDGEGSSTGSSGDGDGDGDGDGEGSSGGGDGDGDGDGSTPSSGALGPTGDTDVDSGLEEEAVLSDLDMDGAAQLCETLLRESEEAVSDEALAGLSCTLVAILDSVESVDADGNVIVDEAACVTSRDNCIALGTPSESASECDVEGFYQNTSMCDASVSEFEDCLSALLAISVDAAQLVTCANLSDPAAAAMAYASQPDTIADVPECASLEQRCPDLSLFDDGDEPAADGCDDTCAFAGDGECDDGGAGADYDVCALGTDCMDCGMREPAM
ncbi:MAG: hypothetical protein PVI30_07815 [Myxococcales bacterium]|jgi:hypothetical protein